MTNTSEPHEQPAARAAHRPQAEREAGTAGPRFEYNSDESVPMARTSMQLIPPADPVEVDDEFADLFIREANQPDSPIWDGRWLSRETAEAALRAARKTGR